ncbi:MAG: CpsD/CapB family tyrosine-protein kinase [Candidatus Eisenbacteria bacterium]|uniref:CpsD/CapB family tyrosine-protein kinase n=1 Tax=Eiseniibacteriota bacterium TaxID=2212470 RepID=A0A937X750_UNCEI|nr:CpsD/CapB family tyrosine-protein kinase [Candidatus Eisenbacteria bacterium]
MSHIYDALRKAGGEEPKRPQESEGASAAAPGTAADGAPRPRGPVAPRGKLTGRLFAEPDLELLKELDRLRASVEVILGPGGRRTIGFVASGVGEGATTVALHFAHLLSRIVESRVLLIDADCARSNRGLSEAAGERPGLTELLRGETPLEEAILATEEPRLHFLPAGRDRIRHIEAATSGRMRPLLEELGGRYDWVVLDIPAALRHPEGPVVGAGCEGVILVVRAHRTRRELVARALEELNFARCRVLGTVLNARRESLPGFLRERV